MKYFFGCLVVVILMNRVLFYNYAALNSNYNKDSSHMELSKYFGHQTEDVKVTNIVIDHDDVQIGGTLLLPKHLKKNALVIMSSGSGQQDRDETLDGFKIFKGIAEHLAEQGIPSFRYDDRGVGESTGDFVNSLIADFSNDIEGIMTYFESSPDYTFKNFILFGHSLGGIIAGDVASQNDKVEQVILMAAPSVPLIDLILFQERLGYQQFNIPRDLIEAEISSHNKLMHAIANNKDTRVILLEFEENVRQILMVHPEHKSKEKTVLDQMAKDKAEEFKVVYALPCIASYLYHKPSESLSKLDMPVLAIYGGKDLQVTIDQNKDTLEAALLESETSYNVAIFNMANHYFQEAVTGSRDEYATLDKTFVKGFLELISNTILKY